jgi:D-alanyl-D-alanine carboxypeptidase/D-alanyl-D-alanine-endopeptidase (penicillin-binding protein 4)
VLADRLTRAGVGIKGQLVRLPRDEVNLDEAKRVAETRTPIAEVFHRSNKRSLNLAADCLLLRAGDGTWAGSAEAMHATLVERFGLDGEKLTVRDGSGLSRQNRVSARNLAILLEELAYRPDGRDVLLSLPRSGVDGSLRKRLKGPARGRVAAKTGTIAGAASLSGYVLDGENRVAMAFSILVNRPRTGIWRARAMADGLCRIMVEHLDDQARAARIADTAEAVKPEESVEASTSADSRY